MGTPAWVGVNEDVLTTFTGLNCSFKKLKIKFVCIFENKYLTIKDI